MISENGPKEVNLEDLVWLNSVFSEANIVAIVSWLRTVGNSALTADESYSIWIFLQREQNMMDSRCNEEYPDVSWL